MAPIRASPSRPAAPVSRTNRPDKRPHSITSPDNQKFLANRAASTKEGWISAPFPPPLTLAKPFYLSGCGQIVPLYLRVMREGLLTGTRVRTQLIHHVMVAAMKTADMQVSMRLS